MKLKSFLKRLFTFGETLEIVESPMNGEIKVVDDLFGDRSMIIGGVSQSGDLVTKLWKTALDQIDKKNNCHARLASPSEARRFGGRSRDLASINIDSRFCGNDKDIHCLILGLGCGNAAKIVADKFPGCEIIGIEIDPKVVEIGKKYFGLDKIKNLKIIVGDALKNIHDSSLPSEALAKLGFMIHDSKFDLIIVDLYIGQEFPKEAESTEFIKGLKNLLNKNGIVIFNRLSYGKYKCGANDFSDKMNLYFPQVFTQKAITNLLIFAGNRG